MDGHQYTAQFEAPGGKPILKAYPDPKTKGAPWTIGLGHCGPDVHRDTVWTEEQCWHAFYNDYAVAEGHATHIAGSLTWARLNDARKAVLADMAFNMGGGELANFHNMLSAIRLGNWATAKRELLDSDYAQDVKTRADMNAKVMLTGEWP